MKVLMIAVMCGVMAVIGMVVIEGEVVGAVTAESVSGIRGGASDARKSTEECFDPTCHMVTEGSYIDTSSLEQDWKCNTNPNDNRWNCYVQGQQECSGSSLNTYSDSDCTESTGSGGSASKYVAQAREYYQ